MELKFYNSRTKQIDLFKHDKSIPINMYIYKKLDENKSFFYNILF